MKRRLKLIQCRLEPGFMSYSSNWYTPPRWIDWISKELGSSYVDVCPQDNDNSNWNGLLEAWPGRNIYCNHPGGRGNAQRWWGRYRGWIHYYEGCRFIWCAFNIEQLRMLYPSPLETRGTLVMPRKRLKFHAPDGSVPMSPRYASAFWLNYSSPTNEPPDDSIITLTGVRP